MHGDAAYRRLIAALWVLVRTASIHDAARLQQAAIDAHAALALVLQHENHVILQEREGALLLNGRRLQLDLEGYAATAAIAAALVALGIGELLLTAAAGTDDLQTFAHWAAAVATPGDAEAQLSALGLCGIHASNRSAEPPTPAIPLRTAPPPPTSQLRSMFVHGKLIAAFASTPFADGHAAKVVLQTVVERLLHEPTGPAALLLLQQDPEALTHAVQAAVLGACIGRAIGCPCDLLADLACACLLHDIGRLIGSDGPPARRDATAAIAGSHWLLAQGSSDLWLRAALVARSSGDSHGARLDELGSDSSLGGALAHIACRADVLCRVGRRPVADTLEILRLEAAAGAFPLELVDALEAVQPART